MKKFNIGFLSSILGLFLLTGNTQAVLDKASLMSLKVPAKVIESPKTVYRDIGDDWGDDFLFYEENLDFDSKDTASDTSIPSSSDNSFMQKDKVLNNKVTHSANVKKIPQRLINVYGAHSLFKNVSIEYPYYEAVVALHNIGVLTGRGSGMEVDKPVIRAEIAKIILKVRKSKLEKNLKIAGKVFEDVKKGEWYEIYVNNIAKQGIMVGFPEQRRFGVTDNITYGEMAKILVQTFKIGEVSSVLNNQHWAQNYINLVIDKGLIPKGLDGEKNYGRILTRGEVAEFIYRTLNLLNSGDNRYVDKIYINIPKFGINIPSSRTLITHPSTWLPDLTFTGAAFYDDTVLGRTILFAHSSIWNFDPTPFGPVFKPLIGGGLKKGETFQVTREGRVKTYEVMKSLLIKQTDIGYLGKNKNVPEDIDFILFTCGENIHNRWIYYAREI